MKKVALLVTGCTAAAAMAVIGAGNAHAAPDVTGETYGQAVAILQSQGYAAVFAGSVGSDLPQSQCIVIEQSGGTGGNPWSTPWNPQGGGTMRLRLNCNLARGQTKPQAPGTRSIAPPQGGAGQGGNRPTPGAGTVTVTPVPVG